MTDNQRTSGRRPRAAVLVPAAGDPAQAIALDLARRVAANGCDIIIVELRPAEVAALHDGGQGRGQRRYIVDVPTTGDGHTVLFGCTSAELLIAELLIEQQVDVAHVHLAGNLVIAALVERIWLLGIPVIVSIHKGWPPTPCPDSPACPLADPARGALVGRMLHDLLRLPDVVCTPKASAADAVSAAGWTDQAPRILDHAGSHAVRGWAELYQVLAGDPRPPRTDLTLSVIVTTYQRPAALRDCLEALTNQTLPGDRFEVIVVDDASEPSAAPVVEAFRDRLDLTFVRLDTNVGLGEARNIGIESSHGDVLFFLDDDDEPAPRCLAEHLRTHAEQGPEVHAVLGWTGPTADQSASVDAWMAFRGGLYMNSYGLRHHELYGWFHFWGGRTSIRRDFLGEDRFKLSFGEDVDLGFRLSQRGLVVTHNRHAVQRVRIGLGATSVLRRSSRVGQGRATLAQVYPQLLNHPTFSVPGYAALLGKILPDRASARVRSLTRAADSTLEALRGMPDPHSDRSLLERLSNDLGTVAGAEVALGWSLGRRRIAARAAGRPLRIGVGISSPLLPALLAELRAAPQGSAVLVVGGPPGMTREQLEAALVPLHADLAGLEVEPLVCDSAQALWRACDVVASVSFPEERHDLTHHALPLPRGPLSESIHRLLHTDDLVGSFR